MNALDLRLMQAEADARFGSKATTAEESRRKSESILKTRFDKQLGFIGSRRRRKAAFCTRRAGKTEADAAYLVTEALGGPDRLCVFVARTGQRAEDLVWKPIEKFDAAFALNGRANITKRTWTLPNGSVIRLVGADDMGALSTKRGDKAWLVIVDESQDFESDILRQLVEDIFGPALEDLGGTMCLTGTPGMVCAGYWYEMTRNENDDSRSARTPGWDVHEWSVLDNPFMQHMRKRLPEIVAERNWTLETPTYVREWLGRWVNDVGALFYKFNPTRNTYRVGEVVPWGPGWQHVRCLDLGVMALVYLAFHPKRRELYEAYSWKKRGATTDEVANHARQIETQLGLDIIASIGDAGGLGGLILQEMGARTGEQFEAAKKTEKAAHVALMNEDFLHGFIKLQAGSPYAQEIAVLPKVKDWDEAKKGKPAPEDHRFDNHCCDAGLYGWRKAYHWLHEPEKTKPPPGSVERAEIEADEALSLEMEKFERQQGQEWWEKTDDAD